MVYNLGMTSSRQTILDFLEYKQASTPLEIALALHMTTANVRHHLSILTSEGVVETIGERTSGTRGRPAKLYALSNYTRQHNLSRLASALLDVLFEHKSPVEVDVLIQRLAEALAAAEATSNPISQRLFKAIQHLNKMHYDAHWEAHAQAPFMIFRHCPYAEILPTHPVLCQMDALLIQKLLGKPAQLTEKLAKDNLGVAYCKFVIEY